MKILVIGKGDQIRPCDHQNSYENDCELVFEASGHDGIIRATKKSFDAIILDRFFPVLDGMAILKILRANRVDAPVIMVGGVDDADDRVQCLKNGADDYLLKPFYFPELMARLEAIVRRYNPLHVDKKILKSSRLVLDLQKSKVIKQGEVIELQPREFRLLEYLMRYKDTLITRTTLLEQVWGYNFDPETNVIDVHISRIRKKIDDDHHESFIKTVRGLGYAFKER